jgi:hypothetical protein
MVLAGLLVISFSACSSGGDSPTGPSPIPNSFQIVSIDNYGSTDWGCFGVTISVTNNTDADGTLTGKFYFGDGASQDITEITSAPGGWPLNAKTTASTEVGRFNHDYAALGTYRVKAEFTANFKNESITRTMEKDFTLTRD